MINVYSSVGVSAILGFGNNAFGTYIDTTFIVNFHDFDINDITDLQNIFHFVNTVMRNLRKCAASHLLNQIDLRMHQTFSIRTTLAAYTSPTCASFNDTFDHFFSLD